MSSTFDFHAFVGVLLLYQGIKLGRGNVNGWKCCKVRLASGRQVSGLV